jgi:hypothetical protein
VNFTQREPLFRDFEFAEAEVLKLQKQQSMHQVSVKRENLIRQCTVLNWKSHSFNLSFV